MQAGILTRPQIGVLAAAMATGKTQAEIREMVRSGVFTPIRPHGKGRGKTIYLYLDEIKAYRKGGLVAVVEFCKRQKRKSK